MNDGHSEQGRERAPRSGGGLGRNQPTTRRSRAKSQADRKRAVYVEQACLTCKARKIRCDGQLPCKPCQRRLSRCRYPTISGDTIHASNGAPSATTDSPLAKPADQVDLAELTKIASDLQRKIALLEREQQESSDKKLPRIPSGNNDGAGLAPIIQSNRRGKPPFSGPSSAEFGFGAAEALLNRENVTDHGTPWPIAGVTIGDNSDEEGTHPHHTTVPTNMSSLYGLYLQDTTRLLQLFHENTGVMFPIVDIRALHVTATSLFRSGIHSGNGQQHSSPLPSEMAVSHLKMVMAVSLLAESGGSNSIAKKVFEDLLGVISCQMMARTFDLEGQILLLLTAFYYMTQDDSRTASRYVVIVCRIMIESGLHLESVRRIHFPTEPEYSRLSAVVCTCMYLDRQLNFNAGLPLSLKDADIEVPEMETIPVYLKAMVAYMKIGSRAWMAMTDEHGERKRNINHEEVDFFDFQIHRWEKNLPKELCLDRSMPIADQKDPWISLSRDNQLLQSVLYLRANQFRIVIMRPLLFSAQTFKMNSKQVEHLTQLASDMIEMIVLVDKSYDLYAKQQALFNIFLSSALSTLLLIYAHSFRSLGRTASRGSSAAAGKTIQEPINLGLELLRSYSGSRSAQRLSKKMASVLRYIGFPQAAKNAVPPRESVPFESTPEACYHGQDLARVQQESWIPQAPGWDWSIIFPDEVGMNGSNFMYPGPCDMGFQAAHSSQSVQPSTPTGMSYFNNDVMLAFMNDFSS